MIFADFVGMQVEKSDCEDPVVGLFVDLAEQVNATADQKRYAGKRFEAAGASPAVIERLKLAWRAALVAPERDEIGSEPLPSIDSEPPLPEPQVDESLAMFSDGDEQVVERARVMLDEMFEAPHPSAALVYWLTVTVDAIPAGRRKANSPAPVPPSDAHLPDDQRPLRRSDPADFRTRKQEEPGGLPTPVTRIGR